MRDPSITTHPQLSRYRVTTWMEPFDTD